MNAPPLRAVCDCPVEMITEVADETYLLRLHSPLIASHSSPGQFVNIRVNEGRQPLLRRPFSVCRQSAGAGWFEVLWRVVGEGTAVMAQARPGDSFSVIGPLGRGYNVPANTRTAILVGGGLGVAPLPFLAERLAASGTSVEVYLGARSSCDLSMLEAFRALGLEPVVATEDGSVGERGFVTVPLAARLRGLRSQADAHLFSCGPTGFLKVMIALSKQYMLPGQIAIETVMACGFGICVGCAVPVKQDAVAAPLYKLACVDGPVFDSNEVELHG